MLGPPLLSSDIYSYAAEGDMVTKGHDPTSEGMFKLQFGEYISHVDPGVAQSRTAATRTGRCRWASPPARS